MFSGQQLKKRREELGLSQSQLAKQVGVSRASYFNWEADKTRPNQKNLDLLAELLEVTPTYFESEYEIVDLYLQLTPPNQQVVLNYTQKTLDDQLQQEKTAQPIQLFEYRVYEKL